MLCVGETSLENDGRFRVQAPAGSLHLKVAFDGWQTVPEEEDALQTHDAVVTVRANETTDVVIEFSSRDRAIPDS
jgi:hypothetical protein